MWIVRVALRRPYAFVVLALLILLLSPVVILRTPTDIFPNVDIPVIAVAFAYPGGDSHAVATLIVASLEGALMMSRIQRNDDALLRVQAHLNRCLDGEVARL